jgi:tetratricopeptide (TPR) repeat protein
MKESQASGYKPIVVNAYAILRPLGKTQAENPDWLFAMGKAFWLNERPERAQRVARKVLSSRPNYPEAHLLLGDVAFEEALNPATSPAGPRDASALWQRGLAARKEYEAVMALTDLRSALRAEALYKLGMVSADLENKKAVARDYWEKAAAADPASRYGRMAQEKLKAVPAK